MSARGAHISQERLEALAAGLEEPSRYDLVHLACCGQCREELASLEAGLAKLGKLAGAYVPPPARPVRVAFEPPRSRGLALRQMGWIAAACVLFISLWVWNKGGEGTGVPSVGRQPRPPVAAAASASMIPVLYTGAAETKYDKLAALGDFLAPQHRLYDTGHALFDSREGPVFVDI